MTAVVPGTFDPITLGHLDILRRTAQLCRRVVVAVGTAPGKSCWFSVEERCELVVTACAELPAVQVDKLDGLLVHYARDHGAAVIVKGLRTVTDFDYELQMAQVNRQLGPEIETLFLATSAEHAYLSSSVARELAQYGGSLEQIVPPCVIEPLRQRAAARQREGHHPTA